MKTFCVWCSVDVPGLGNTCPTCYSLEQRVRENPSLAQRMIQPYLPLAYLAAPYTGTEEEMHIRFETVCRVAAKLFSRGQLVFSPISHTRHIALAGDLPHGWEFWNNYDSTMLLCCRKLIVLMLEGWRSSRGVQNEIALAKNLRMPIEFLTESSL